jgi:biopolymer transport protein ExbB
MADYSTWKNRAKITINTSATGADIPADVTNFPVLVRLTSSNFTFADAMTNGEDIRFSLTDGTTALSYEIERWVNPNAEIWVLVPTITANNATQHIMMYWGKNGSTSLSDSTAVFDTANGFAGVWHLNEDPSIGSTPIKDRTINHNDGTALYMTSASLVTGEIGKGLYFNGADTDITGNWISISDTASMQISNEITVSSWVKPDATGTYLGIGGKLQSNTGYGIQRNVDDHFRFQIGDGTGQDLISSDGAYSNTDWHYVAEIRRDSTDYIYVDGTQQAATTTRALSDCSCVVHIGRQYWNYNLRTWQGIIDEYCISNVGRSSSWIKLSYEIQKPTVTCVTLDSVNTVDCVISCMT